jgi:hypothetical protein
MELIRLTAISDRIRGLRKSIPSVAGDHYADRWNKTKGFRQKSQDGNVVGSGPTKSFARLRYGMIGDTYFKAGDDRHSSSDWTVQIALSDLSGAGACR